AVLDDAPELLRRPGQEPRHVLERDERNVETVAEPDEAGALERGVDVETSGQVRRLIGDDPDRPAAEPSETDDQIGREAGVDFEEIALVEHRADDVEHVVGLVRLVGYDALEAFVAAVDRIPGGTPRRLLEIVLRQEGHQLADQGEALLLAV